MTGPNARTVTNPQPGLYLFTGKYFSIMMVMGDHPRPIHPTLPEVPKATAQEILAVYGPYVANTGTYEVNGGTLIMHPMVSKNPELMGGSVTYSFELQGNSLTLKMVNMVMGASVPPPPLPPGNLDTYPSGMRTIGGAERPALFMRLPSMTWSRSLAAHEGCAFGRLSEPGRQHANEC